MDLKLKGKSWAGNIYHQFESICQDVDDFMTKDPVKFVGNQVQGVGISVKRFYSNVVQDILPLSGDIVKPKSVSVDDEQVYPITDIGEKPVCINGKDLSVNQGSIDALRNSDESLPIELDHLMQFNKPPSSDPSKKAKSYLHSKKDGSAIIWNDAEGVEENISRVSMPISAISSFDSELFSGRSDEYSTFGVSQRALGKDETLCDSLSTKGERDDVSSSVHPPELVFSFSWGDWVEEEAEGEGEGEGEEEEEVLESTSANLTKNPDNICYSHAESNDSAYNISTPSTTSAVHETNMLPDFLVWESNDNNAFRIDGSSKIMHSQHYKDFQPHIAVSPSETGGTSQFGDATDDLNMETVDLSPDMKNDVRNVVLNDNFFHAASLRRTNFRYYKKLIQDAFTSRKRLSKEYEQLAIFFGDIDMESNQLFGTSSSTNTSMNAIRTPLSREIHETEWELL